MPKPKTFTEPSDAEIDALDEERALDTAIALGELEPLIDSPALNKRLLKNARQSANVIEQRTGIPAAEVAERLTALLDNPSWRDDLMEEKLLLKEVAMLVDDIRDRMSRMGMEDEAWASMARVQLAAIKTLLDQVTTRRKAVDGQLTLVNEKTARLITNAILVNNQLVAESLAKKYGVSEEEIYAEWSESYPEAVKIVEAASNG
jgi:uncharacterized protein YidB (DUF937 family)